MSILSIIHVVAALGAVGTGSFIFGLRKGDRRHGLLGWIYVACMLISLVAILARGLSKPAPFHLYAAFVTGALLAALMATRFRRDVRAWRSWHAALMSFTMLAAVVAAGGVVGGLVTGAATGPAYYRMFNVVIVCFSIIGLWFINTRPVIWGKLAARRDTGVRLAFTAMVSVLSAGLIAAQWVLFVSVHSR